MAGAVFGEVEVSFFVAGAVFGEIWNDSRSAKCCIFQYKMLVVGVKSNLGCEAGCGVTVSWSDHSRIILGMVSDHSRIGPALEMTFQLFSRNFFEMLERHFAWQAPRAFSIEKYNISRSGYHSKFHRILRLPRKVTVQHHQILRLPRKVTVMTDPRHI